MALSSQDGILIGILGLERTMVACDTSCCVGMLSMELGIIGCNPG